MHENDTRAVFVGGPWDGKVMMLQDQPSLYQFDEFCNIASIASGPTVSRHMYCIRHVHGGPSLDDEGFTRYDYKGWSAQ